MRWKLAIDFQNESFEMYMSAQMSMGRTEQEAYTLLARYWEHEHQEHLEAIRRIGEIARRAR